MKYNEQLFGTPIKIKKVANQIDHPMGAVGSINGNLEAGYLSGAFKKGEALPDDLYYWLINSESPYSKMGILKRIGTSPNYEYIKEYSENSSSGHVPIVIRIGAPRVNSDINIDPTGSYKNNLLFNNAIFTANNFKKINSTAPLWYKNETINSNTINGKNEYSSSQFLLDFDYNDMLAEIYINTVSVNTTLTKYIENNNTSENNITAIHLVLHGGLANGTRAQYNTSVGNYLNDDGIGIIQPNISAMPWSGYKYQTPPTAKAFHDSTSNQDYEEDLFTAGTWDVTSAYGYFTIFEGTPNTGSSYRSHFYIDDEHFEFNDTTHVWQLKKHGTGGTYSNEDFDFIRKLVAYLGFWFTDGSTYVDEDHSYSLDRVNVKLGDKANEYTDSYMIPDHVYQAVIKDGVTTGEFIELRIAKDNDQSKWGKDWRKKNGYEGQTGGGGGDRPRPTPDPSPIRPYSPGFTLAGKGTQCYALTGADMDEIMTDIFGRSGASYKELVEGLAMFGSDPMGAILSYKWYPFAFSSPVTSPLYLGQTIVNESHIYPIINNTNTSLIEFHGSFWLGKDKNFIQSKKTQCRLYLPFYGFYEISMPLILSQVLDVDFHYNVPDETAVWIISFGNVVYDYLECVPSIEIPLTGTNAAMITQTKKNTVLQIATQVANMAASAFTGGAAIRVANAAANAVQSAGMAAAAFGMEAGITSSAGYGFALGGISGAASAGRGATGLGLAGMAASGLGAGVNIYNTYKQAQLNIANMRVNVPYHGAADATTFLNLEMRPYIQFYTPDMVDGYNEAEYRLTVGHACDIWTTLNSMPNDSLCQTSGTADINTNNMEITEIQELNEILTSGFYK